MKRSHQFVAALSLIVAGATQAMALDAVSVNVGARGTNIGALTPTEIAGVVPKANWNDFSTGTFFEPTLPASGATPLVDSNGVVVPGMAFTFGGLFGVQVGYSYGPDGLHDENLKLMTGMARGAANAALGLSLSVTNIPYPTYDLYVYADGFGSMITQYVVNGNTYYGVDSSPANFIVNNFTFSEFTTSSLAAAQAELAASPSGGHNYVKFSGLTASNLLLSALQSNNGLDGEEAINGFQIVAVPEPGTLALAGVAAALAVVRRRRS